MSQSVLFSTHLHDLMSKQKVSADQLQHDLGYQTSIPVRSWIEGRARPPLSVLPALAVVLRTDPVALVVGWLSEELPEMEAILRIEVLEPRGSIFPRSDDLALRAPKPLKPVPSW